MTIADSFKKFFLKLNGSEPTGTNIADIVSNGSDSVQVNNENAIATRLGAVEHEVATDFFVPAVSGRSMSERVLILENTTQRYHDYGVRKFFLKSSTEGEGGVLSDKIFAITVSDTGALTATEVTQYTVSWTVDDEISFEVTREGSLLENGDAVVDGDEIWVYATPPAGRTLAPITITGATHSSEVLPDNPTGKGLTVEGNVTISLSLVAVDE